jgi:hypothetical protein
MVLHIEAQTDILRHQRKARSSLPVSGCTELMPRLARTTAIGPP